MLTENEAPVKKEPLIVTKKQEQVGSSDQYLSITSLKPPSSSAAKIMTSWKIKKDKKHKGNWNSGKVKNRKKVNC